MSHDTSQRKSVRKAEKQKRLSDAEKLSAVSGIMSHPNGRHWFHDLLEEWGAFRSPFTGHDPTTNYQCGVQSCALKVLQDIILAAPDQYIQMMKEANQRKLTDERRTSDERARGEAANGGVEAAEFDDNLIDYGDTGDEAGNQTGSEAGGKAN